MLRVTIAQKMPGLLDSRCYQFAILFLTPLDLVAEDEGQFDLLSPSLSSTGRTVYTETKC